MKGVWSLKVFKVSLLIIKKNNDFYLIVNIYLLSLKYIFENNFLAYSLSTLDINLVVVNI